MRKMGPPGSRIEQSKELAVVVVCNAMEDQK